MVLSKPAGSSKKIKEDQSVMETNNSSIVSKRSVERLYYPEPHFFRYFVKRPQRRAPLINRGYWLRMHAIDEVVRQFLEEPSPKNKVVLNLGCGYDPLAFQWLSKVKGTAFGATFIDVDFPELIQKKSEIIRSTSELQGILGALSPTEPSSSGILLRSEHYSAIGCDLADTTRLDKILATLLDLSQCLVLCTAEVSITYMNMEAADSLIAWAAHQEDFRFCLLEQYLPDGADHPFAKKMLQHFNNLRTRLKNINAYPRLSDQVQRFSSAGFNSVKARSLWHIFCDPHFVSNEQRLILNKVEPFDEWEELLLFASHYFLLVARHDAESRHEPSLQNTAVSLPAISSINDRYNVRASVSFEDSPKRRFAPIIDQGRNRPQIAHVSGLGPQTRTSTIDMYLLNENETLPETNDELAKGIEVFDISLPDNFGSRMCHTASTTTSGGSDWLIAGGRKSPDQPLKDCWILRLQRWDRGDDLPIPLYRHCQTHVWVNDGHKSTPAVLVYGGKSLEDDISDKWFLWRSPTGWAHVAVDNTDLVPRFGAVMIAGEASDGILLGGMTKDGMICQDLWLWSIVYDDQSDWKVKLTEQYVCKENSDPLALSYLYRFGASLQCTHNSYLLIGGVADEIIPESYELLKILFLSASNGSTFKSGEGPQCWPVERAQKKFFCVRQIISKLPSPRPLFIGHSSIPKDGQIVVIGGGAVCFSFGTHWNTTPITFAPQDYFDENLREDGKPFQKRLYLIHPLQAPQARKGEAIETSTRSIESPQRSKPPSEGLPVVSAEIFFNALSDGQPIISRDYDLGPCVTEWQSLDTVKDRVGHERAIIVHVSNESHMDFQHKNFEYVKKSFGNFIDDFRIGRKQYLRSLASEDPTRKPANLTIDFPRLASDFHFFENLKLETDRFHSSILRISGSVDMWLHYDVMANVLCQIRGSKRLILFPPSDVSYLGLSPGSSTSSIDCFSADFVNEPALAQTHPRRVLLQPGDVLYIPPLWLHTASPGEEVSISVNVFFRSLGSGYAPGRDVYGNRDVQVYEKARRDIEKITRSFEDLPTNMRRFYLDRLADELKASATRSQSH